MVPDKITLPVSCTPLYEDVKCAFFPECSLCSSRPGWGLYRCALLGWSRYIQSWMVRRLSQISREDQRRILAICSIKYFFYSKHAWFVDYIPDLISSIPDPDHHTAALTQRILVICSGDRFRRSGITHDVWFDIPRSSPWTITDSTQPQVSNYVLRASISACTAQQYTSPVWHPIIVRAGIFFFHSIRLSARRASTCQ